MAEPPLKLVLIEDATHKPGSLNHFGVEVDSTAGVAAARARLAAAGLADAEMPAGQPGSSNPSGAACCGTRPDLAPTTSSCC